MPKWQLTIRFSCYFINDNIHVDHLQILEKSTHENQ